MAILKILMKNPLIRNILFLFVSLFLKVTKALTPKQTGENTIVLSFHRLGDTVFTIPAIKGLIDNYEDESIIILCYPEQKPIYEHQFSHLKIITISHQEFRMGGWIANRIARKELKKLSPNSIIDLTGTLTTVSLFLGIERYQVVGLIDAPLRNAYDKYEFKKKAPHLIDMYIDAVRLSIGNERIQFVKEFDCSYSVDGIILIHPFAGWSAKEWEINNFISLANTLAIQYKVGFVFEKGKLEDKILKQLESNKISYFQTQSIAELIVKIKSASLFISNDSGPLYIANMLGKPTFSIYGPTNPDYSSPFGKCNKFIRKEIHCTPYNTQYCHTRAGEFCPSIDCLNWLTVEEVYSSIKVFMNELNIKKTILEE